MIGTSAADTLDGGPGNDQLFGDALNDLLIAKDGAKDTLDGFDAASRDHGSGIFDVAKNIEKFI